jgi:hypothetical protein
MMCHDDAYIADRSPNDENPTTSERIHEMSEPPQPGANRDGLAAVAILVLTILAITLVVVSII